MAPIHLIPGSRFSPREFRDAKRAWSERLLLSKEAAALDSAVRRTGAHAPATAARAVPLRRNDNVVGVGIAEKLVRNKPTGVLAVTFFVKTKLPASALSRGMVLPKSIDGLPVDVQQSGAFHAFATRPPRKRAAAAPGAMPNPRVRIRPAPAGSSIGYRAPGDQYVMAGTFGAVVKTSSRQFILSNNHVLADENRLPIGSAIYQPGLLDGGTIATDQVARLTRFIKLRAKGYNRIDAAIAEAVTKNLLDKNVLHIGAPKGTVAAAIDMMVHKFGRTTSYTSGAIISIDTDVVVQYETGEMTFDNQIVIVGSSGTMFSDAGDSGSLILQRGTNAAVGLLFAGSASHTIANHMGEVLRSLRVQMA